MPFELLHDGDNGTGTDYGLVFDTPDEVREIEQRLGLNLPVHNGTADWRLPMPARIVVASDGIVRSASVQADHALRAEPQETLQVLRVLASS